MLSRRREAPAILWRSLARVGTIVLAGGRYHDAAIVEYCLAAFYSKRLVVGRRRNRFASAIKRWEAALGVAEDMPICHYALSANLRKSGDFGRARAIVDEAVKRFPDDLGVAIEAARVAERFGEDDQAYTYWLKAASTAKPRASWREGAIHALMVLGRFDEAEAMLADARMRHPRHRGLMAVECKLASSREDWARAVPLWTDFNRRFPNYSLGWWFLGQAIYAVKLSQAAKSAEVTVEPAIRADVGSVEDEAVRQLLLGFASIGENCEFGLVQRRFRAEPLDLLRWNIVRVRELIDALEHDMEGVGEPEHTELLVLHSGEFFSFDRRWYLGMHTFLFAGQTTHEALYPAVCFRLEALRTTFLEDLAAAGKIFVYRSAGLDRDSLSALHKALRKFGPNTLLAVQPVEPGALSPFRGRPGDLTIVEPGCYVGFLRRLGVTPAATWDIAFDDWVSVCRKAVARRELESRRQTA